MTQETQLEHINVMGASSAVMLDHVFDCHEELTDLRAQLTEARRDGKRLMDALKCADKELQRLFQVLPVSGPLPSPEAMQEVQATRQAIDAAMEGGK